MQDNQDLDQIRSDHVSKLENTPDTVCYQRTSPSHPDRVSDRPSISNFHLYWSHIAEKLDTAGREHVTKNIEQSDYGIHSRRTYKPYRNWPERDKTEYNITGRNEMKKSE